VSKTMIHTTNRHLQTKGCTLDRLERFPMVRKEGDGKKIMKELFPGNYRLLIVRKTKRRARQPWLQCRITPCSLSS